MIMFSQLRSVYPEGCLVTELVSVKHCRYIVRALLQVSGVTIASALASGDRVELAEDQAQKRLFTLLELDSDQTPDHDLHLALVPPPVNNVNSLSFSGVTRVENIHQDQGKSLSDHVPLTTLPDIPVLDSPVMEEFEEIIPIPEVVTVPEEKPKTTKKSGDRKRKTEKLIAEETVSNLQEESPSIINNQNDSIITDNSNLLAKTTVEIKRLGWTNPQGREHLIATYGKTMRAELNDEELLDFLTYLQSLETPEE
jgi:hypothetical protein